MRYRVITLQVDRTNRNWHTALLLTHPLDPCSWTLRSPKVDQGGRRAATTCAWGARRSWCIVVVLRLRRARYQGPFAMTPDTFRKRNPPGKQGSGKGRCPHIWYCRVSGTPDIWIKSCGGQIEPSEENIRAVKGGHYAGRYFTSLDGTR